MQRALYQNQILNLAITARDRFQYLYEASLRGEMTCAHCGEPVKLYLGIEHSPYFYHAQVPHEREECSDTLSETTAVQQIKENPAEYRETNGFRIPKGRAIGEKSSTVKEKATWRSSAPFSSVPAFRLKPAVPKHSDSPYLNEFKESGIELDSNQWKAVTHSEGPLLILAGAGSGKTRVLTARTAYMIQEKQIDPKSIMLVTFTAKSAKEMKERLATYPKMSGLHLRQMLVGTFHSIFLRMIVHHNPQAWQMDRLLKWDWQKEQIVKEAARELHVDEKDFPFDQALQQIGYWKNTLVGVKDVRPKDKWEQDVHFLYRRYEEVKKQKQLFDFDDMLYGCYEMLKQNPDLLTRYQKRFRYFLIDEFQDINKVQYKIMKMLSEDSKNLCVVGDDDQSIYAFRGSDPSFILNFEKDFANTTVITLNQNYRSAHAIVSSANKVIARNTARRQKEMAAQFDNELRPTFFFPYDEEEEATMIVTDMKEKIKQGASPTDFAVLYRTHASSRAIFERLSQSNLPFSIEQDADSFYKRRMVRSLLSFLRLSVNPNDASSLQDLVNALFLKKTAVNDLKAASILHDGTFIDALEYLQDLKPFQQKKLKKVIPLFKSLKSMSPSLALETISKDMGFDDFVKKRGNEGNMMEKGSDDVRDLKVVARKFKTVPELLEHVDHMIAMNTEMKALSKQFNESIQLTTIHRAKGLEYKHVYVLSSVDGGLPHDYALEAYRGGDDMPLQEERRLLYVAMTRAQNSLYLSVPQTRRGKTAYPSRFLKTFIKKV
ncbi:ATP-dependent helicase [Priestia megaterium]|uniref:ATP-dependent helicase n=1 Tax=Priestia megaterium TaxID=1404 RepID=UPI00207A8C1B|nr:ATP-dependent helicase [Priestia megaterium]USL43199.1 ATP-dependent helicase [Priestia megaterium]